MNESELQQEVERLCESLGLLWFHDRDSRRNNPGFPDLVVVGRNGVVFAELKSATGTLRPAQRDWCIALRAAGARYVLWRPESLADGTILRELVRLRGTA